MARSTTLREKQALEIVQVRLLGALFADNVKKGLYLKGGFAMRMLAKSGRFTDDIDLLCDPSKLSTSQVKLKVNAAIKQLVETGLVKEVPDLKKDTDTTTRWVLKGAVGNTEYNLKVEVSHRDEIDHERIARADYTSPDGFGCIVDCIDLQSLAVSKLDCLSNPTREKPRDVFDLVILIDMDIKPDPELIKTLDRDQIHRLKTELWDKLEKMGYATAEASLLPFLPKDKRFSEDKWHEMRLKVGCKVEEWLANIDVEAEHLDETELTDTGMTP